MCYKITKSSSQVDLFQYKQSDIGLRWVVFIFMKLREVEESGEETRRVEEMDIWGGMVAVYPLKQTIKDCHSSILSMGLLKKGYCWLSRFF